MAAACRPPRPRPAIGRGRRPSRRPAGLRAQPVRCSQAPRRARAARPGGVRAPFPGRGLRGAGARRLATSREVQPTWTRALGGPAPPSADSFNPSGWNKLKTPSPAPSGPLAPSRPCPAFHSPYQGETRPPGARISAPPEPECRRPRRHSQPPCALRGHLPQNAAESPTASLCSEEDGRRGEIRLRAVLGGRSRTTQATPLLCAGLGGRPRSAQAVPLLCAGLGGGRPRTAQKVPLLCSARGGRPGTTLAKPLPPRAGVGGGTEKCTNKWNVKMRSGRCQRAGMLRR